MQEVKLTVHPFWMGTDKEAGLKPLEEAAETFGAWQALAIEYAKANDERPHVRIMRTNLADAIQACVNLADRYGLDLADAMERCEELKRAQGFPASYVIDRYSDGTRVPKAEQVARIGNSVVPTMAREIVRANVA